MQVLQESAAIDPNYPNYSVLKFLDSLDASAQLNNDIYSSALIKKLGLEFDTAYYENEAQAVGQAKVLKMDSSLWTPKNYTNLKDFLGNQKAPGLKKAIEWFGFDKILNQDPGSSYYIKNDFADKINKVYSNDFTLQEIENEMDILW